MLSNRSGVPTITLQTTQTRRSHSISNRPSGRLEMAVTPFPSTKLPILIATESGGFRPAFRLPRFAIQSPDSPSSYG